MVSCCGTWIIADKREVETVESGHRETIEEVLDMKRKLTSMCCGSWWRVGELKRERRMQFESKYWGGCLLIYPFVCLFTRLLIYPFVCLFVCLFSNRSDASSFLWSGFLHFLLHGSFDWIQLVSHFLHHTILFISSSHHSNRLLFLLLLLLTFS